MKQSIKDRYNNIPQHTKERVDYFASELVAKDKLIRSLVRRNQYLTKRLMELETVGITSNITNIKGNLPTETDYKNSILSDNELIRKIADMKLKLAGGYKADVVDDFIDDMLEIKQLTVNPPYQANALNDEFSKLA